MKIGIISFAHLHAYSYAEALNGLDHIEFVGIYDDDEERGRMAAKTYGVPYFSSLEAFLSEEMDAVIVTSENSEHYVHVKQAAEAKKHILCEKPLATTKEDGRAIIQLCEQNDVKLQTAFPVRFNTPVRQAKAVLEQGELGKISAVKATNRGVNPGGWFMDKSLSGGGAVIDHTVHVVDILRWFMDAEVTEVYAEIDTLFTEHPIDDAGLLTMEFDNGVFATLDCSWSRSESFPSPIDVTLEIVGTKGTLSIDAFAQSITVYSDINGIYDEGWGDDMDLEMINDFSNSRIPAVTGRDGLKALEVALAAYQSSENNQPARL